MSQREKPKKILLKRLYLVFDKLPINRPEEEKRRLGLAILLFSGILIILSPILPYAVGVGGILGSVIASIIFIYLIIVAVAGFEAWIELMEARRKPSKEGAEA